MMDEPGMAKAGDTGSPALPAVVDRATWQAQLDGLLVREKARTREVMRSLRHAGGCPWSK